MSGVFNVLSYGAVGDGVTDDTVAIRSALTAAAGGGAVYLPWTAGGYLINSAATLSLPLTSNMRVFGDGPTRIINASSTADVFQVNGSYGNIELDHFQVQMKVGVTATAGWMLNLASTGILWVNIHDILCNSIQVNGGPIYSLWGGIGATITSGSISNVVVRHCFLNQMIARGIQLQYSTDWVLDDCLISMRPAGSGNALIVDTATIGLCTSNLLLACGLSSEPAALIQMVVAGTIPPRDIFFGTTVADESGVAGWQFFECHRVSLSQCWAATQVSGAVGVAITYPARNIEFHNCIVQNNSHDGYLINSGSNIGIIGGEVIGNSVQASNTYNGITCTSPGGVRIIGVRCARDTDYTGNQRWGIRIDSTTSQVTVQGCDLRGNGTAPTGGSITSASPTGLITNNLV